MDYRSHVAVCLNCSLKDVGGTRGWQSVAAFLGARSSAKFPLLFPITAEVASGGGERDVGPEDKRPQ